jgi:hypothetical protein
MFETRLLRQLFRLEWLRQRCEFNAFESEKQPLFDGLGHFSFITRGGHTDQAATTIPGGYFFVCVRTPRDFLLLSENCARCVEELYLHD